MAQTLTAPSITSTLVMGANHVLVKGKVLIPLGISSTLTLGSHFISSIYIINVYINDEDVSKWMLLEGTNITDSLGNIKGMFIKAEDSCGAEDGKEIVMLDLRTGLRVFAGVIKEVTEKFPTPTYRYFDIMCQDYTKLIDIVTTGVTIDITHYEYYIVKALCDQYTSDTIKVDPAYVIVGNLEQLTVTEVGLREALNQLAGFNGRIWYVDYNGYVHYFAPGDEMAPFGVSDTPNGTTTFPYFDLEYTQDAIGNQKRGSFKCWKEGLFAGQEIEITNAKKGWTAEPFIIYEISADLKGGDMESDPVFEYLVSFGSRPRRVTDRIPPTTPPSEEEDTAIRLSEIIIDVDKDWISSEDMVRHGIYGMKFLEVIDWIRIPHGLDANKSASPIAGDFYIATDTEISYACYADGTWTAIGGGGETMQQSKGSATQNWYNGTATSGLTGGDIANVGVASEGHKIYTFMINTENLTAGATIQVRMYQYVNGVEKLDYKQSFLVGQDTPSLPVINGAIGIWGQVRIEMMSDKSPDNGKAVGWEAIWA